MINKFRAIEILTSQEHFYIDLGLHRIKKILDLFDNPQDKLAFIHVAGTNGKGSVCSILNKIIQNNGFKTGLYTSPHIFEYNERIRINGICISDDDFAELIFLIHDVALKNKIHLTEFEILTVLAFIYFEKNKVDVVVLETGLGGRFDATNVISNNLCSIITHIDLEHTDRLGDSIDKISFEKAGIIKEGCPIVLGEKNSVIENVAREKSSHLVYAKNVEKICSLNGLCQKQNLALAIKACEILNFNVDDDILMQINNPCRFEYLKEYDILVDVAHNPNGILALRNSLDYYFPRQNFDFIFGCLNTKDYEKMLKFLLKPNDNIFIYEFSNINACNLSQLQKVIKHNLFNFSKYKKSEKLTVICGSFYMLKELFFDMGIKYNMNNYLS